MSEIIIGVKGSETGNPLQNASPENSTAISPGRSMADYQLILTTLTDVGVLKNAVETLQREIKRIKPVHKKQGQFINVLITSGIIAFVLIMLLLIAQCFVFLFFLKEYYPNGVSTIVVNWVMTGISIATLLELVYAIGYTKTAKNAYLDLSKRVAALEEEGDNSQRN